MSRKLKFGRRYFILLLMAAAAVVETTVGDHPGCQDEQREMQRMGEEFEQYQTGSLMALKDIISNEQNCPPFRKFDDKLKTRLTEAKAGMEMRTKALIAVATTPVSERKAARVPHPKISAGWKKSTTFSCESSGEPLISCVWSRMVHGRREAAVVDAASDGAGGTTGTDGVSYFGHDLQNGKCSVRIESTTRAHFGTWSCLLITQKGDVFYGNVEVKEAEPAIYFATNGRGLKAYSMETSETSTGVSSVERLNGVAYDFHKDLLYWSSNSKIYKKSNNGSQVTTMLRTTQYGDFEALDYDWVTGYLYVSTYNGQILACDTRMTSSLRCTSLVTGQRKARGIAVHPIEGLMFWTSYNSTDRAVSDGSVSRSGMDGRDLSVIVTELGYPKGIAIDFQSSRLYWADSGYNRVQSSNLGGTDIQTVFQLPTDSGVFGIALHGGRIYCTDWKSKQLQSFTMAGQDVRMLHEDTQRLQHLAIISSRSDLPRNRTNHCANQQCPKLCVLTRISFRCVP